MAAKRKPEESATDGALADNTSRKLPVAEISDALHDFSAAPSPARQLQAHVRARYFPVTHYMTGRFVTLGLLLTTLGTWLAGTVPTTVL